MNTNKQVGPVYLVIEQFEEENPYRIEAFVPNLPGNMEVQMDIKDDLLDFEINSNQAIDLVAIEIELGDTEGLETYWTEGITLDMSDNCLLYTSPSPRD